MKEANEPDKSEKNEMNFEIFSNINELVNDIVDRNNIIPTISLPNNINNDDNLNFKLIQSVNNLNNIDLSNIKNLEKSHSFLFPVKKFNDMDINIDNSDTKDYKKKFIKDSFFNDVLLNTDKQKFFEDINSNKNFTTLSNQDRTNSSIYFFYPILKSLKESDKMKKIEEKLNNQIKNLTNFQKENISLISSLYKPPEPICKEIKCLFVFGRISN